MLSQESSLLANIWISISRDFEGNPKKCTVLQKEFPAHSQTLEVSIMSRRGVRIWEKDSRKKGVRFKNGNFILSTNHDFSFSPKPYGWIPSWLLPQKSSWNSTEVLKTLHLHPVYSPYAPYDQRSRWCAYSWGEASKSSSESQHFFGVKNCHSLDIQSYLLGRMVSWGMFLGSQIPNLRRCLDVQGLFLHIYFFSLDWCLKSLIHHQKKNHGVFFFRGFFLLFHDFLVFKMLGSMPDLHNCRFRAPELAALRGRTLCRSQITVRARRDWYSTRAGRGWGIIGVMKTYNFPQFICWTRMDSIYRDYITIKKILHFMIAGTT